MRIPHITSRRSLQLAVIILPLFLTLMAISVASTTFAQSNDGGLGVGQGFGQEVGINLDALNRLRQDINAGMYNRACTPQEHNRTQWHTLVNPVAKCHYDHIHGDDPNYVNDIFGEPGAWFGAPGQSISYPWQTFPAATANEPNTQYVAQGRMENDLKHEGYIWVVRRDQDCRPEGNCTTDFRLQTHAIMGAHDMPVRFHSFSFEARVCGNPDNPSTCGIVRVGGWIDMGRLFTTAPNDIDCGHAAREIYIPLPADTLYFPIDRPDSRDEIRCHPNLVNLPRQPSTRPLAEWWGHSPGDRIRFQLRSFDPIGNVDMSNPAQWHMFCQQTDGNCRYDASIFSVWIGYILKVYAGFDNNDNYIDLDPDGNNIATFRAYMDRWGTINSNCRAVSLDCIPVEYNNVVLNEPQWREGFYHHTICDNCTRVDHDISPTGQKWITWFYRYAPGGNLTQTPAAQPTTPPVSTATQTFTPTPAPALTFTPTPIPTLTPTTAPDGPAVIVEVNPTQANVGSNMVVTLSLRNVSNVYGLQSECTIDPTILVGNDITWSEAFNDSNSFVVNSGYDPADGSWLVAGSRHQPHEAISGDAPAYSLNYSVQNPGTTPVNCTVLAVDSNGQELPLEVVNGTFSSSSPGEPTATLVPTEEPTATPVPTDEPTVTPLPTEGETPVPPTETPEVGEAGAITGTVSYQNAPDNAGIAIQLLANDVPVADAVTDASGAFTFTDLAAGAYTVNFIAPLHLVATRSVNIDASGQTVDLGNIILAAGDTNSDGKVDVTDATFVGANFNLDVPPGPNNADMNRDLKVNISDLVLVGSNYGLVGPILAP